MKTPFLFTTLLVAGAVAASAEPSLTIYNENFAVVRDSIQMTLKPGVNEIRYPGVAMKLEPDSVVLRDPTGKRSVQILEQSFRNDPVTQDLLLSLFEGQTIEFLNQISSTNGVTKTQIIEGKIIRSGYTPHYIPWNEEGDAAQPASQPIIEVNGKLRFSLPGEPQFPTLTDETILKPTLSWLILADKPGRFDGELGYMTGGIKWEADYNLVAPETGDTLDLVGWITINNQSGKSFDRARIKLMAGDVNKVQPPRPRYRMAMKAAVMAEAADAGGMVTEKAFDEYHLYTMERPSTLRDREIKQVEFVRGANIQAKPIYVYDGAQVQGFEGWNYDMIRENREYGTQSNKKVTVVREFRNAETNHLGLPLPKGKLRFYRRDTDGQLQFTGENVIDHTPKDELIRVTLGNAFDLVGERTRTDYKVDNRAHWIDESFEIKVRNHKKTPVEIRVLERLYRGENWEIREKSDEFTKKDSRTIEFPVQVKPDEEKIVTYKVHYTW
jgi:hypothetical protein